MGPIQGCPGKGGDGVAPQGLAEGANPVAIQPIPPAALHHIDQITDGGWLAEPGARTWDRCRSGNARLNGIGTGIGKIKGGHRIAMAGKMVADIEQGFVIRIQSWRQDH